MVRRVGEKHAAVRVERDAVGSVDVLRPVARTARTDDRVRSHVDRRREVEAGVARMRGGREAGLRSKPLEGEARQPTTRSPSL